MSDKKYPTKAKISRAVTIARELGLDVAGFEISPDGLIRIVEARAFGSGSRAEPNAFDRFQDQL